jgi:hypothetical protein
MWVEHPIATARFAGLSLSMVNRQKSENEACPADSAGMIVEVWNSIEVRIPIGYQNETGFHFGLEFISSLIEPLPENQTA